MSGLILKDFLMMRTYFLKQLALMSAIFLIISVTIIQSFAMMAAMLTMSVMMIFISSFSFDEAAKWDAYALTLPVTPKAIVGAKYILFYGALAGLTLVSILVTGALEALTFRGDFMDIVSSAGAVAGMYGLVTAVMMPIIYKFGAEKARVAMSLCFMIPFIGVIWGLEYLSNVPEAKDAVVAFFTSLSPLTIAAGGVALLILLTAGSFFLSVHFYTQKEF